MHQPAIATVMLHNISPQTQWHTTISTYTYDHNSAGHLGQKCFREWVHELAEVALF